MITEELMDRIKRYAVVIEWSDLDGVFIATVPDFGVHTHGATREEAATRADEVIALVVATDARDGTAAVSPRYTALADLYPNREHVCV